MTPCLRRWVMAMAVLLLGGLSAALAQDQPRAIQLYPEISAPAFSGDVWHLPESGTALSLDQVRAQAAAFQRRPPEQINLGTAIAVKWLRLDVVNAGTAEGQWLLTVRQIFADILDIYVVQDGKGALRYSASDAAAAAFAARNYTMPAAPLFLAAGQEATVFIRYHGVHITRLPMAISTFADVAEARLQKYLIFGVIVASVAAFALYSCAIFMLIGGRAILYFAASELAFLLLFAYFNGFLTFAYGPNAPLHQNLIAPVLNAANVIFTLLFVRNFFSLRQDAPRLDLLFRGMVFIATLYLLLTGVFTAISSPLFEALQLVPFFLTALMWLVLPPLGLYATLRWRVIYWPLVPGWLAVSFYNIYPLLGFMNIVPEPPFHPQWLGFTIVIQAFFLAVAIVLQVRQLRDDRLRGQIDLNASLQQQLAAANKNSVMLREMADQGRLVQAAGHDTRSILHGLRSFAASLAQGADAGRVSHTAQEITYLTDDLEAVLSTTIAGAAGGGSENILALEQIALSQALSVVQLIHERTARTKKLRFSVHAGPHELVTDRALLARIIGNLVDNAFHYTARGGVIVAARRHANHLRIQIWDSGTGIAPDLLARLLDPHSGPLRGTHTSQGQGGGLQTVKALAAQLGGSLAACSRPGHGSRFELVLPLVLPVASQKPTPISGRLWILHSDPPVAEKLRAMAAQCGVTGIAVSVPGWDSGTMAAHDLVLIDMHFGGTLNGIEIAKALTGRVARDHIFICTFERGVDVRAKLAPVAGAILYQPVTSEALRYALTRKL